MGYGLYRLKDDCLGDCARIASDTGDGAPYLSRKVYELLGYHPPFEDLPAQSEFNMSPVHSEPRSRQQAWMERSPGWRAEQARQA